MAERKAAKKGPKKSTTGSGLTAGEKAALKETLQERRAAERGANDESAVLAKIAEMSGSDRAIAKRLHALIKSSAPELSAKTWYGMPAYANKEGKVVCFFKPAEKFKSRYATLGFEEAANLDEGAMWTTSFALTDLTPADEKRIAALVKKAVS